MINAKKEHSGAGVAVRHVQSRAEAPNRSTGTEKGELQLTPDGEHSITYRVDESLSYT